MAGQFDQAPEAPENGSASGALTPGRLNRLRWKGEEAFRVLSYYFSIRWNWSRGAEYANRVLRDFSVPRDPAEDRSPPTPGMPPRYSLVKLGRGAARPYQLYFGDLLMLAGGESSNVLEYLLWHVNSETIRRTGDFLLIHAGAVTTPAGDGLLIIGESGSGKTTLTAALVRSGFGYLSDEAAAIDPVTRRVHPYPKALTIKAGPGDLVPELSSNGSGLVKNQRHVPADAIRPGCLSGACDVRFVVFHRYRAGAETTLSPITPAAGTVEMGRNALNPSIYGKRALPLLADVARGARHYTMVSGTLEEAVQTLRAVTGATDRA